MGIGTTIIPEYSEIDEHKYFNVVRRPEEIEPLTGGIPFIFVTPPLLGDWSTTIQCCPIVKTLTKNQKESFNQKFMKILTNRFKMANLGDMMLRTTEEHETYYGWKQVLPGPIVDSYQGDGSLNITYSENKDLDITNIHIMWMQYIEAVRIGMCDPNPDCEQARQIDYMGSLYYFLVDMDLSTILFWAKYTGIYPISIPTSQIAGGDINSRGLTDMSITYACQYKEYMNQSIITDFIKLAPSGGNKKPIDKDTSMVKWGRDISNVAIELGSPSRINFY